MRAKIVRKSRETRRKSALNVQIRKKRVSCAVTTLYLQERETDVGFNMGVRGMFDFIQGVVVAFIIDLSVPYAVMFIDSDVKVI